MIFYYCKFTALEALHGWNIHLVDIEKRIFEVTKTMDFGMAVNLGDIDIKLFQIQASYFCSVTIFLCSWALSVWYVWYDITGQFKKQALWQGLGRCSEAFNIC